MKKAATASTLKCSLPLRIIMTSQTGQRLIPRLPSSRGSAVTRPPNHPLPDSLPL